MADLVLLSPHERMNVRECLSHCLTDHANFQEVIVVGYDPNGELVIRTSKMSRKDAAWILHEALDYARGAL